MLQFRLVFTYQTNRLCIIKAHQAKDAFCIRNRAGLIMYADVVTGSMRYTIEETERRRKIQDDYNRQNGIEPKTIISSVKDSMQQHLKNSGYIVEDYQQNLLATAEDIPFFSSIKDLEKEIHKLEAEMRAAAKELAFEKAATLRDRIKKIRLMEIELG